MCRKSETLRHPMLPSAVLDEDRIHRLPTATESCDANCMQQHDTTSAMPAPRKPRKNATQKSSVALRMNNDLLDRLDACVKGPDMDVPGYRFHPLKGERAGEFAVSVSGNWRLTFAFDGEDAINVDLEDFH